MDKKTLQERLKNLETLKDNHTQDIHEIDYVMEGMQKQIKAMPDEPEEKEKAKTPLGV